MPLYLAEKSGRLLPAGFRERSRVLRWLMFQMGVDVSGLDNLLRWIEAIDARPAAQKGLKVPYEVRDEDREQQTDGVRAILA